MTDNNPITDMASPAVSVNGSLRDRIAAAIHRYATEWVNGESHDSEGAE